MADYYTLETVKDQILRHGGTVPHNYAPKGFLPDWQYCPCIVLQSCNRHNKVVCDPPIYVGVYARPPRRGIPIIIEIIYERETHRGLIRANNLKLNDLIGRGKIDQESLEKVTLPF